MSTPPVSTSRKRLPAHSQTTSLRSRVTPGVSWTTVARVAVSRLTSVDLPTFGKPTTATFPSSPASIPSGVLASPDESLDAGDDVLHLEARRVDLDRIGCGLHAGGIALVADTEVGRERVGADVGPFGDPAPGAHLCI